MASKPPAKLKFIAPFITRGRQVDAHNPVIAYWCFYWAVQHILSNNLHSGDPEATRFTGYLLDELEQRKSKLLSNEAVTDDVVAQAYIEDFAQEVFQRADGPLQSGRATRKTADTFLAAAVFLELCKIFDENNPEINQKIKYSKYHAARILKAIQSGENPNIKSPVPDHETSSSQNAFGASYSPPSVEDVPDEDQLSQKRVVETSIGIVPFHQSSHTQEPVSPRFPIIHPRPRPPSTSFDQFPAAHSPPRSEDFFPTHRPHPERESRPATSHSEALIPHDLPQPYSQDTPPPRAPYSGISPALSASPSNENLRSVELSHPPFNPLGGLSGHALQHQDQSSISAPVAYTPPPPPPRLPINTPDFYSRPRAAETPQYQPTPPPPPGAHYALPPAHFQINASNRSETVPAPSHVMDSEDTKMAQKYARWAISALDYDDYPTAIENLRNAMRLLGAS